MSPKANESSLMFGHTKRQERFIVFSIVITFFTSEALFWLVEPAWAKVILEAIGLSMFVLLCINIMHLLIDPVD